MSAKRRKGQKSGGGSFVFSSISFIVICAALVFGMSVFFRVSDIEVSGAERYTAAEIIEASGIEEGDSLMMLNRQAVADKISMKLVYIGKVVVSRKLPSTVSIEVLESGKVATVETDAGPWIVDSQCKLLEQCSLEDADKYVSVIGIIAAKPAVGAQVSVAEEDKAKLDYLKDIFAAMSDRNMMAEVGYIDVSNSSNAQFEYNNRFKVKLGRKENTEYKLGLLISAVSKLDPGDVGIMDLSEKKQAHFSPN